MDLNNGLDVLVPTFAAHCNFAEDIVLEVACGSGDKITKLLGRIFQHPLTAIDKDLSLVMKNIIKCCPEKEENAHISTLGMDATKLMFKDDTFNVIVVFKSLQFIRDIEAFFREAKRVLNKNRGGGGTMIMIHSKIFELESPGDPDLTALVNQELEQLLSNAFCSELSTYWDDMVQDNFQKYCHPDRILPKNVTHEQVRSEQKTSALDIRAAILEANVVQSFIQRLSLIHI